MFARYGAVVSARDSSELDGVYSANIDTLVVSSIQRPSSCQSSSHSFVRNCKRLINLADRQVISLDCTRLLAGYWKRGKSFVLGQLQFRFDGNLADRQ